MLHKIIDISIKGEPSGGKLYTYFLDNSIEIDINRKRPLVLICPGGGYAMTSDREAEAMAVQFLAAGYHAAVLRYSVYPGVYPTALLQAAWSVAHIRQHAEEYHVDPDHIILQGSSAGGHLAASYGVFWNKKKFLADTMGVEAQVLRPNGLILSYPVITSGEKAHGPSFENLLGERYGELVEEMSLEKQVSRDVPPVFLWHTVTDTTVPVENSLLFFQALHAYEIPVEMHIYPVGVHGLGLANEETASRDGSCIQPECQSWIRLAIEWIKWLQREG